jgi:hypothetical protein
LVAKGQAGDGGLDVTVTTDGMRPGTREFELKVTGRRKVIKASGSVKVIPVRNVALDQIALWLGQSRDVPCVLDAEGTVEVRGAATFVGGPTRGCVTTVHVAGKAVGVSEFSIVARSDLEVVVATGQLIVEAPKAGAASDAELERLKAELQGTKLTLASREAAMKRELAAVGKELAAANV